MRAETANRNAVPEGSDTGVPGAVRAAELLRALANPHRLMILRLLRREPHTVMSLCSRLDLRQSLVSQHLARLRLDGVVSALRQGHFVIYSMTDDKACQIFDAVAEIIDGNDPRSFRNGTQSAA